MSGSEVRSQGLTNRTTSDFNCQSQRFHGRTLATITATAEVPKDFSPSAWFSPCALTAIKAVETAITEPDSGDYRWRSDSPRAIAVGEGGIWSPGEIWLTPKLNP